MKKSALGRKWLIISLLISPLLLSACGQKGALYHPEDPADTPKEQKRSKY